MSTKTKAQKKREKRSRDSDHGQGSPGKDSLASNEADNLPGAQQITFSAGDFTELMAVFTKALGGVGPAAAAAMSAVMKIRDDEERAKKPPVDPLMAAICQASGLDAAKMVGLCWTNKRDWKEPWVWVLLTDKSKCRREQILKGLNLPGEIFEQLSVLMKAEWKGHDEEIATLLQEFTCIALLTNANKTYVLTPESLNNDFRYQRFE